MLTLDQLIDLIDKHGLTDHKDFILKHSKPSIYLSREYVPNEDDLPIGASKIGGNPDLPADFEWRYYQGNPLTFLAQIKLSDVKPYDVEDVLPDSGWLYFFYTIYEIVWGESDHWGSWQVVYIADENTKLTRLPHPCKETEWGQIEALPPFRASFSEYQSMSISDDVRRYCHDTKLSSGDKLIEPYVELLNVPADNGTPFHYLLGNPLQIQGDVHQEAQDNAHRYDANEFKEDDDWQLLFQVDSDYHEESKFDLTFGDNGLIYFMIRTADLQARDFTEVWTIMQCS